MSGYEELAEQTLDRMALVFEDDDRLLASIGTVVVYYIVFRDSSAQGAIDRQKLMDFEELRREASRMPEDDSDYGRPANARLREYNVFVQSTNDGRALSRRAKIMEAYLVGHTADALTGLDDLADGELPDHDETEG